MEPKRIRLLVLAATMALCLAACGGEPAPMPDIDATVEARVGSEMQQMRGALPEVIEVIKEVPVEKIVEVQAHTPLSAIPTDIELDHTMKEKLLALANNRDSWFLTSDITTDALEGLYGSWSVICRNETSVSDYKKVVYDEIRPWLLEMLKMELKDAQKANRYYKVERWSSPWAYVEQTWKLGDKIVLGPEHQLYLIESGAWRYHDC